MANDSGSEIHGIDKRRPFSSFFRTVFEVLVRPAEFFSRFSRPRLEDPSGPVIFAVTCSVVSGMLVLATLPINPLPPVGRPALPEQDGLTLGVGLVATLVIVIVLAFVALLVGTIVQHLLTIPFIRLGERIKPTFLVVAYAMNAVALLSWIPVFGYLAILYGFYVVTIGLREDHRTTVRALLAAAPYFLVTPFSPEAAPCPR